MMEFQQLHPWDLDPQQAIQLQVSLQSRLSMQDRIRADEILHVAGIDNSYFTQGRQPWSCAAIVVLRFEDMAVVETRCACLPVTFPYIPGLLSFREIPPIAAAWRMLATSPDLVFIDGHGYAHPRRFGLACHFGLLAQRPTIGCAKSRLSGLYQEPGRQAGAQSYLLDEKTRQTIGAVLRTRPSHSPLFVSIGNQISLETAIRLTLACCRGQRFLPEPARLAHQLASDCARRQRGQQA